MGQRIHNFKDSLAFSHEYEDAPWWEQVYRKAFVDFKLMYSVRKDGWAQRGGIDRIVVLESSKELKIDEKVRRPNEKTGEDYKDILLEYESSHENKTPGWIRKDLACDYIAYAFTLSCKCYLFPFQQLRKAWRKNLPEWWAKYPKIPAKNKTHNGYYTTMSLAIPIDILFEAINDAMVIDWDNEIHIMESNYEDKIFNENNKHKQLTFSNMSRWPLIFCL